MNPLVVDVVNAVTQWKCPPKPSVCRILLSKALQNRQKNSTIISHQKHHFENKLKTRIKGKINICWLKRLYGNLEKSFSFRGKKALIWSKLHMLSNENNDFRFHRLGAYQSGSGSSIEFPFENETARGTCDFLTVLTARSRQGIPQWSWSKPGVVDGRVLVPFDTTCSARSKSQASPRPFISMSKTYHAHRPCFKRP